MYYNTDGALQLSHAEAVAGHGAEAGADHGAEMLQITIKKKKTSNFK